MRKELIALLILALLAQPLMAGRSINATVYPQSIAMRVERVTLYFTVTDTSTPPPALSGITEVRMRLPSAYYSASYVTSTPPGWYAYIKTSSGTNDEVTFVPKNESFYIPPGGSLVFAITVTGPGNTPVPADATDMNDVMHEIRVTYEGGGSAFAVNPTWWRRMLVPSLQASPGSVAGGGNATVTMNVENRGLASVTSLTPSTLGMMNDGTAFATLTGGPAPASYASLAPNATTSFIWNYTLYQGPGNGGSVVWWGNASGITSQSPNAELNPVYVGSLTASLSTRYQFAVSGQAIAVTMRVTNPTGSDATNVRPSNLTAGGTAVLSLINGSFPESIAVLPGGASIDFTWYYSINGSLGNYGNLTGYATADGGVSTANATTKNVYIVEYYATVEPSSIPGGGGQNISFIFTVYNEGQDTLRAISVDPEACPPDGYTSNQTGHSTPLVGWDINTRSGSPGICGLGNNNMRVDFSNPDNNDATNDVQISSAGSVTVLFSQIGTIPIAVPKPDVFVVGVYERGNTRWVYIPAIVYRNLMEISAMYITEPANATDYNVSSGDWAIIRVNVTNGAGSAINATLLISGDGGDTLNATDGGTKEIPANGTVSFDFNVTHFSVLGGWHTFTAFASSSTVYEADQETLRVWVQPVSGASLSTGKGNYAGCSMVYYRMRAYNSSNALINANFTAAVTDPDSATMQSLDVFPNNGTGVYLGSYPLNSSGVPGSWLIRALVGTNSKGSATFVDSP